MIKRAILALVLCVYLLGITVSATGCYLYDMYINHFCPDVPTEEPPPPDEEPPPPDLGTGV
ncbi:hypothetical protein ACFLV1_01360 [Chloroflexota bacterium]